MKRPPKTLNLKLKRPVVDSTAFCTDKAFATAPGEKEIHFTATGKLKKIRIARGATPPTA